MKRVAILSVALCVVRATAVFAQVTDRLLPAGDDLIPAVVGDQREPRLTAKLLFVTEATTLFGNIVEGEAGVGKVFPVYLASGSTDGDYVIVGLGAGIWGRFNMETRQKHLLSSDWNFRIPVAIRRGATTIELSYNHLSSHFGDDYSNEFGIVSGSYSVDDLRALVFRAVGDFEVLGGGRFAVNVNPLGSKRLVGELGVQRTGVRVSSVADFFAGLHLSFLQDVNWDPRISFRSGIGFLPERDNTFSIVFEALTGPSPEGQFVRTHETFFSIGVNVAY